MAISFNTNVVITDNSNEFTASVNRGNSPLDIVAWKGAAAGSAELIIASVDQVSGDLLEGITLSIEEARILRDHLNRPEVQALFGGVA